MRGMLGLSMTPLVSAVRLAGTASTKYIEQYFRFNNGVGDSGDLAFPIVIPAGTDFKIQTWVNVDNFDTFYQIFSGDRTTLNTQSSTGLLTLFLPILSGGSVSRSTTGVIDLNKLNNVVVRVTAGDLFISINGVEEEMVAPPALDDFIISRFCGRTNIGSSSQYVGIMPPTMVWINDVLTDWYKFDDPNSVYQRNHAVPQGVELYSDSFALPEFYSRDGNIITKTDTTSETIFIANVEAGKQYRLSFRKNSHSTGSPNLRDQFNNQYVFPLMSPLESSGKNYEFVFNPTTDGKVGINGAASLWSISELSIKEFNGCEIVGGMPEDWVKYERQPGWEYWLEDSLATVSTSTNLDITRNCLKSGDSYTRNSTEQSCYVGKTLITFEDEGKDRLIRSQIIISNLSNSALYIPIRLQGQYPARMDVSFTREGEIHIPVSFSGDTDIAIHELSAEVEGNNLVINVSIETSQRLSFYISPRNEATGDLDNLDTDTTVKFDFNSISTSIKRKLEIAQ
jgi:hypothetical protein